MTVPMLQYNGITDVRWVELVSKEVFVSLSPHQDLLSSLFRH